MWYQASQDEIAMSEEVVTIWCRCTEGEMTAKMAIIGYMSKLGHWSLTSFVGKSHWRVDEGYYDVMVKWSESA